MQDPAIALDLLRVRPAEQAHLRLVATTFTGTTDTVRVSHVDQLVTQYSSILERVGKLINYQLKIHTDPVAQPLRRAPFHISKDVDQKLLQLTDLDIIEDTEGPTPWVSRLAPVPKSNGIYVFALT